MKTLVFLLSMTICASSQAADYSYTRIVDTSGTFSGFVPSAGDAGGALNDSGAVAFVAQLSGGGYGIFRSDGAAAPVTIALGPSAPPSMNRYGVVGFVGKIFGVSGLFTGNGQTINPIATANGPLAAFVSPVINDTGGLAFTGFDDNTNRETLLRWDSGSLTTIAQEALGFSLGAPACNNNGEVAFISQQFAGGSAVLTGFGGRLEVIAAGALGSIQGVPSINDSGVVAFKRFDDPWWNIYTGDGGQPVLAFQSAEQLWIGSSDAIAINASGQIAFRGHATHDDHPGIYIVSAAATTKVIGQGDSLDGSTAIDVQFNSHGLNKHGRIAFYATLADGRKGIYRSAPICIGDVTTDQSVNVADLLAVIAMWGDPPGRGDPADVNHDGLVNAADLLLVLSHWGACP